MASGAPPSDGAHERWCRALLPVVEARNRTPYTVDGAGFEAVLAALALAQRRLECELGDLGAAADPGAARREAALAAQLRDRDSVIVASQTKYVKMEQENEALRGEAAALQEQLDRARDAAAAESARMASENERLTETAVQGKQREAHLVNENTALEQKCKEALEKVKALEALELHLLATPVTPPHTAASPPDGPPAGGPRGAAAAPQVAVPAALRQGQRNCHRHGIASLDTAACGGLFATGSADGLVKLWGVDDLALVEVLQQGDGSGVERVRFSPAGDRLAACTQQGSVLVWSVARGQQRLAATLKVANKQAIVGLCFDAAGSLFTVGKDRFIRRWDLAKGAPTNTVSEWAPPTDLAATGHLVASAHAGRDGASKLLFWDSRTVARGQTVNEVEHGAPITSVSFSADGGKLLSSSLDGVLKVHDVRYIGSKHQFNELATVRLPADAALLPSSQARLSPDARLIAVGASTDSSLGAVHVYDTRGKLRAALQTEGGHQGGVPGVAWAADGSCLLSAGVDNAVLAWKA
eukprot:TRINITY_DN3330_c0_g1_i1.p1 TRINITY_DN3330_c0_g1~~TRINITY_DN3330_c0_g1_i1.p1  ORF type:complete len:550 (+),score=216.37 TRINITY_DN3330_c0_g1_i1:71-1651(+)